MLLLAGIPMYVGMRWWQQRDTGPAVADRLVPSLGAGGNEQSAQQRAVTLVGNGSGERGHDA